MDPNKRISGELATMLPLLAQTMETAIKALRQSSALAEVLIERGLLRRQELDEAMQSNHHLADKLAEVVRGMSEEPN